MNIQKWRSSMLAILVAAGIVFTFLSNAQDNGAQVRLRIEGASDTLFDGSVNAGDCTITDTARVEHLFAGKAVCALAASGIDFELENSDFGLYLKNIGTEDISGKYWSFWVDYDYSMTGIADYSVVGGEELLLALTPYDTQVPLRISVADSVVTEGEEVTVTVEKSGVFEGWSFIHGFSPAEGAVAVIGDLEVPVQADGSARFVLSEGTYSVRAYSDGYIRSGSETVTVAAVTPSATPTASVSASPSPTLSVSPSPSPSPAASPLISPSASPSPSPSPALHSSRTQAAEMALGYLRSRQDEDGGIGGGMVSGWSAMAFGADGVSSADVKMNGNSLLAYLSTVSLNSATDVERQILAVRASGGNPRSFNGVNLVNELKGYHHDGQVGQTDLINDDIFAVPALLAAGEDLNSTVISDAVVKVVSAQNEFGDWGSLDLTAAAIQALRAYEMAGGEKNVSESIRSATDYLRNHSDSRGGWGDNSATTAWVMQAFDAVGESYSIDALLYYQGGDGAFGWQGPGTPSLLMTAYAVPALLGESWPIAKLSAVTGEDEAVISYAGGQNITVQDDAINPGTPRAAGVRQEDHARPGSTWQVEPGRMIDVRKDNPQPPVSTWHVETGGDERLEGTQTPGGRDRNFVVALFSLANMGIGVSITRFVTKLFL